MGDTPVEVDAGLFTRKQEALVRDRSARRLLGDVHRLGAMPVPGFQRVVGLEPRPFVQRQFEPVIDELLAAIDAAEQMAPDFLGGLHLARDLVGPVVRDMTIGAARPHAGAIGEMDGRFQFREHIIAHLMAAGAELLGVGQFQRGVEAAPEHHTCNEPRKHQHPEPEHRTRPAQHIPQFDDETPCPYQRGPARLCRVDRTHRRPPGAARLSMVSISTKSLVTGGVTTFCGTWHSVQKNRRGEIEAKNWPSRSMKWVMLTIGACDSAVRARAWHDRHLLPLMSIW